MKKYLLKTWLLSIMMVLGVGSAWAADPDLVNDYTLVKSATFGDGADALAISDSKLSITAYETGNKKQQAIYPATAPESIAGWVAFQAIMGSKGWTNKADNGLWSYNAQRSAAVYGDDLTTGWLVVFDCSQTASNVMTLTNGNGEPDGTFSYVASEDGKSYYCTITAAANAYVGFCGNKSKGYITKISVYKPNQAVIPTTYTVKYQDMSGNTLKNDATYDAIVGASVSLSDADKANITVEGTTYIYDSDDSADKTVAEEGATVITVKFHAAANYNYTVNEVCGETIARTTNATSYETANVKLGYRKYNAVEGQLYTKGATSKEYNYSFKLTQDNQVENIVYSIVEGTTNVVFCAEGEDIEGLTPITEGNTTIRSSNSASAYAPADTKITTLAAGKYKIHAVIYDSASSPNSNWTFMAGPVEAATFNCTTVNIAEFDSEEFAIGRETDIIMLKAGSTARGLDAIYIVKTGDLTADEVALLNAKADLQEEINVAKALANGKEGVDALNTAISDAEAALAAAEATVESLGTALTTLATAVADFVKTTPILTFTGTVGEETSLTFGVYDTEDTFYVDFGDGTLVEKKVGVNNAGPVNPETGQTTAATEFKGTIAGDGTIKVYGINDVWYLVSSGAMPTALDQAKLMNVQQMTITGANVENVALPEYTQMTQFNFNNSPVKTLDVSKVTTLTSLSVDNTTQSQYAPQLESIDLSANTELNYVKIVGNATNKGKLAAIDLSKNTKLANVYLQDNAIKTAVMPEGAALSFLNLQNNELETIDLSVCASNKDVYLDNNKLKSATLGVITKSCKLENNQLTLATMPAQPASLSTSSKTKKFTYAPQAALQVADLFLVNDELDLSAQATVAKGELNPKAVGEAAAYTTWLENKATVFTVKTVGETPATLVVGTDYNIEGGKITFLKGQDAKVYVEMTNEALPKFTGANAFKTTEFDVKVLEDVTIDASDITEGDITTAIATKTAGKLVKNITINLAAETKYTVSAAIEVPAGLTINGNGATIDASALEGNMIQWINIDEAQTWTNADVAITAVTVKGLKKALFYSNSKYYYGNFTLINSFIEQAADATTFDYTKGSVALNFTIAGSTIYAPTATTKSLYSSQAGQKATEYNDDATQNFLFSLNTMYNLAKGKNFFTHRQNSQKWLSYTVQNNLFVNCGKSGQVIKGLNGGSSSVNPTWTIKGNAFNFDGADTSANEETGDADHTQDETPGLNETVQDNVAGVMTFTNVETPDFGGTFEMPFGATAPEALGDNRWTITFTNAPAPLYIIGGPKEWKLDDMTEMTYNATTQAYEYEYAPTSVAYFAISDVATAESWDDFNANHRYAIGESDKEVTLNEAIALQKVNGTIVLKPVKEGTTYKISIAKDLSTITISGEAAPEPTEDTYVVAGNNVDLFGEAWNGTYEANTMTLNETSGLYEKTYTNVALKTGTIEYKIVKNGSAWYPGENQKCEIAADGTYDVVVTFDAVKLEATMVATVATGINSIAADKMKDATIFTIGGQRVEKAQKGLYIINGKKVVIK